MSDQGLGWKYRPGRPGPALQLLELELHVGSNGQRGQQSLVDRMVDSHQTGGHSTSQQSISPI